MLLVLIQDSRQSDKETVEYEQSEKHYKHLTLYGNLLFFFVIADAYLG